jgi:hypothetical protein
VAARAAVGGPDCSVLRDDLHVAVSWIRSLVQMLGLPCPRDGMRGLWVVQRGDEIMVDGPGDIASSGSVKLKVMVSS